VGLAMGVRVTVTMAAVCLALIVTNHWIPMHAPAFVLGMITAIQGTIQVKDRTAADRAITRVYAAVAGFAVITGIALVGRPLVRIDALLLVVVFFAAYARRFGPRMQAVGMFAFMCGVIGSFLEPTRAELPQIAFVLAGSGVVAHLVHDHVMRQSPAGDFRRVVAATLAMSGQLRRTLADFKETRRDMPRKDVLLVTRLLRSDIRMCQNYLPMEVEGPSAAPTRTVTRRLLDLQLAVEAALDVASPGASRQAGIDLDRLQQMLDAIKEAERQLKTAVATLPASFPEGVAPATPAPARKTLPARGKWLEDPQLRMAIQVTLACAIAMVGGRMISSDRWFWAVLTAFLIYMNTQSGGDVAVRGMNRALGTLAGIVLGIALASTIRGDLYLTLPLAAVSVFGAFYLARISYAGMNVCINVAISLIYGLVGIFTPELLVLRLEETAIGAAAGIFCALAVLPLGTWHRAEQAMDRLLRSLETLTGTLIAPGDEASHKMSVTAAAAATDAAFAEVVNAFSPLRSAWTVGVGQADANRELRRAYLLGHAAHLLERAFREREPSGNEVQELRAIHARLGAIRKGDQGAEPTGSVGAHPSADRQAEQGIADEGVRYAVGITSAILRDVEAEGRAGSMG